MKEKPTTDRFAKLKTPKLKRDFLLPTVIVLALIVLVATGAPAVYAGWYQLHYRDFVGSISNSTYYAYQNNCLYALQDGEEVLVTGEHNYLLYGIITEEPGKLLKSVPEREADIVLYYGDGGVLELWNVELTYASASSSSGVCWRWTDAEGEIWIYNTDNFTFTTVSLATDLAHNSAWERKYTPTGVNGS
jgi:hypothetical protein